MAVEKHQVRQRMQAIELIALWEGRLVTHRLMEWYGISRQQASADIGNYLSKYNPAALVHDPAAKGYVPTPGFKPVISSGHINEYMELLAGKAAEPMAQILDTDAPLSAVQLPNRTIQPMVVRELIKACRSNGSLKILYASMGNPVPAARVISPHKLVYTGFRWHVRAYCHKREDYRDFLLSRIREQPIPADTPASPPAVDTAWEENIAFTLIPNLALNPDQQALVAYDYGMEAGQLCLTVRKALAHYTLQRYQAAITEPQAADPLQYPLQLLPEDRTTLAPYLFGGGGA